MNPSGHIGILGGSFNPVHIGHMILADYIAQFTDVNEVWLMLSPLNPLKEHPEQLISDSHRLAMLRIAAQGSPYIKPCDIELTLPKPSYTANSLDHLSRQYPHCRFSIIIGSDNWHIFDRWYRHDHILSHYSPIIYPRPGYPIDADTLPPEVTLVRAPVMDISSTFIRKSIAAGHCMNYFLPQGVNEYIVKHHLYTEPYPPLHSITQHTHMEPTSSLSTNSLAFIGLCNEYCAATDAAREAERSDFVATMLRLLPRLYIAATDLRTDGADEDSAYIEPSMDEDYYDAIRRNIENLMGPDDTYLEVFEEDMKYSDTPIAASIAEGLADILQVCYNFIETIKDAPEHVIVDALYAMKEDFQNYWSRILCNVLRALNHIHYSSES